MIPRPLTELEKRYKEKFPTSHALLYSYVCVGYKQMLTVAIEREKEITVQELKKMAGDMYEEHTQYLRSWDYDV